MFLMQQSVSKNMHRVPKYFILKANFWPNLFLISGSTSYLRKQIALNPEEQKIFITEMKSCGVKNCKSLGPSLPPPCYMGLTLVFVLFKVYESVTTVLTKYLLYYAEC